ncbi:MAG: hypothetical protein GY720_18285 [bacterium]|nr:hypothetical protein [bacterium]
MTYEADSPKRLVQALTVLALICSLLVVPNSIGTANAELTAVPDETWGVVGLYDSLTTGTAAEVMAIEQIGNTIYVGGKFIEVVYRRSDPHHDQPFLAAFDATTGDWIDWWRPELNGAVFALEAAPDGSRLYVGGDFTSVNGVGDTAGLVALDPATGEVDTTFTAQVEGSSSGAVPGAVRTIRAISGWIYVGGSFNYITGPDLSSRTRLYRLGRLAVNGTPDASWRPLVTGGSVWGLDVDPVRGRVYLAGYFDAINGAAETGNFVAVRVSDATPITNLERFPALSPGQPHQFEVLVDGDNVWTVGAQHVVQKLNADDLSIDRRWFTGFAWGWQIGGDFQSIGILGDRVYASCHCWGVIRELADDVTTLDEARVVEPIAGEINGLIAFDRDTGDWIPEFYPDLYGPLGGWAIHGSPDGCLWAGGDFNRRPVGDSFSNGIVRFCDEAGQGPPAGPPLQEPPDASDSNPPSRPLSPAVADGPGDDVIFSWDASTDDTGVTAYAVFRDGVEELRTRRTNVQLETGGTLAVQALDLFGNVSQFSGPVTTPFVLPDVLGHWPLDGSTLDMSGNDNHGTATGTQNMPGPIIDAQQLGSGDSITVDANSDLRIGSGDGDFTISTWLRLDTTATGSARDNLAVDGTATIGTAAVTNRARVTVTTSTGTVAIESTSALSMGTWAHVALVRNGNQATLYLDGNPETNVTLTGTTSAGNGALAMTGNTATLDDVIIHDGVLTAGQVDDLANAPVPNALWAHYPFEGNATDASGNGFNGTVTGPVAEAAVDGLGYRFDGTSGNQIIVPNNAALRPGDGDSDFTVAYWFNLQEDFTGEERVVVQKGADDTQRTFYMAMRSRDNRMRFRLSTDVAESAGSNSTTHLTVGEWVHVTYVKRGDTLSLYFDGQLDQSRGIAGTVISNDGDLHFGDTAWSGAASMLMDDFRIYRYGMSKTEVLALRGIASPPDDPPAPVPPAAVITGPDHGAQVNGTVEVAVEASSPVDAPGTLDVDVQVGGTWQSATWNAADGSYNYLWDTTNSPLGSTTVQARATDSNDMTTDAANKSIEVIATPVDYAGLVIADGAVAYWKLNDGGNAARDAIDQTHRAVFDGPTTKTAALLPEGGRSATFDGANDLIRVADHVDLNTGASYSARSVELWFEADDVRSRQVLWEEGGAKVGISIYLRKGKLRAGAWDRSAGGWADDVFVSTRVEADTVYHVVLTMSEANGKLRLFVNGERVGIDPGVEELGKHGGNMAIGARRDSTRFADKAITGGEGAFFDGTIDEVAIYNVALNRNQVQAHYGAGLD